MEARCPPPAARLLRRSDFLAAARGRRFHTERMTVQSTARAAGEDGLRIGLTVTRKVGHATERNRIKRRLRVAGGALLGDREPGAPGLDLVVIARRSALAAPLPVLIDDLRRAVRAAGKSAATTSAADTPPRSPRPDSAR